MKRFIIKTLGCKTNQVESDIIREILSDNEFSETDDIKLADYFILNSCSVTHIADTKNLAFLRRAKRENPNIKTILTGCMAQLEKDKLIEQNIADFVVGNYEKHDIISIIRGNEALSVSDIFSHNDFRYRQIQKSQRTRAFIKIQDGCNNRCSYCTIPFARGNNRSDLIKHIIEQINIFIQNGYMETVFTGIHIGQWGLDFKEPKTLVDLLEKVEETEIKRYRLGSLNPTELSNEFLDFLSKSKKFCPHFHLSLQSCCNKTLKSMNRNYNEETIFNLVEQINKKFELPFIGCDIIAGFAGENDNDFETTLNNLDKLNISKMHIFPYSRRKGTIADKLPNQICDSVKKMRCSMLQEVSDKKLNTFLLSNINKENEVIIEKNKDKKTNLLKGVTKNYINVLIDGDSSFQDTLQKIIIIGFNSDKNKMLAKVIK